MISIVRSSVLARNLLKDITEVAVIFPTPDLVELYFFTRYRCPVWTKCVRFTMPLPLTFRIVRPSPWAVG